MPDATVYYVLTIVVIAFVFDFINGFHDSANSIATVVATRVLSPFQAVVRLFDEETNPISVIKWKEALDFLEQATDRCEDVANVIEGVTVKHG